MAGQNIGKNIGVLPIDAEPLIKRTACLFYDNGRFPGSSTNDYGDAPNLVRFQYEFESCGIETDRGLYGSGDPIGPNTGWTPQFTNDPGGWVTFGEDNIPWAEHSFDPQPAPMWRAWKITTCDPRAQFGKWTLKRTDNSGQACVFPVKVTSTYDYCWRKEVCDPKSGVRLGFEWYIKTEDGYQQIEAPEDSECYVSRDFQFNNPVLEGGVSPCKTQEFIVCDGNNNGARVLVFIHDCDGTRTREYFDESLYLAASDPTDIDNAEYDISNWNPTDCNDPTIPWEEPTEECEWGPAKDLCEIVKDRGGLFYEDLMDNTLPGGDSSSAQEAAIDFANNLPSSSVITSQVGRLVDGDAIGGQTTRQLKSFTDCGDEPITARFSANSEGSVIVRINGTVTVAFSKPTVGVLTSPSFTVNPGDFVEFFNIDNAGVNSVWNLEVDNGAGNFALNNNVFDDRALWRPEYEVKRCVERCDKTGIYRDWLTKEILDPKTLKPCTTIEDGIAELCDKLLIKKPDDVNEDICDFSVSFKSSGITSVLSDKGESVTNGPHDFTGLTPGQNASNDPLMASAQQDIQDFLDANGGGTVILAYNSQSILTVEITGTSCMFTTANDDSNPGPHEFMKTGPVSEITPNRQCLSYSNFQTSGYRNWTDNDDYDDLASEFGFNTTTVSPKEMWVRITEFDCNGTSQSQTGQIFGPYVVGSGAHQSFLNDLSIATNGTCLQVGPSSNPGPNGIDTGLEYIYDSSQNSTLVLQEGVSNGTGGVNWFTSAQGVIVRNGDAGDFIESTGIPNPSTFANIASPDDFNNYVSAEDCVDI